MTAIDIRTGRQASIYTPPEDVVDVDRPAPPPSTEQVRATLHEYLSAHPDHRGMDVASAMLRVNHDEDRLLGPERGV